MGDEVTTRLARLLTGGGTGWSELVMGGLLTLAWGLWLVKPGDSISLPAWAMIRHLVSEQQLGVLMILLGTGQMVAYLADHRFSRWLCALVGCLLWEGLAVLFWFAAPTSLTLVTYSVVALTQFWACLRLAGLLENGEAVGV